MTRAQRALTLFRSHFNCSQSVLAPFAGDYGVEQATALKMACGFGGGMGSNARTCGAVTGALLVIGLKYGKHEVKDRESKPLTYRKVKEFIDAFERKHGSVECKELLGTDISSEKGLAEAREKKLFRSICFKLVEDAVDILENEIL